MVVNDAFVDLGSVHESERSKAIDFAREAGGEVEDGVDSIVGKDINRRISGELKVSFDIFGSLRSVKRRDMATEVNALGNGLIDLFFEDKSNLRLAGENERHGGVGIHIEVEEEPNFGKHFHIAKMGFVDDDDRDFVVGGDEADFLDKLAFGFAAKEMRFDADLVE